MAWPEDFVTGLGRTALRAASPSAIHEVEQELRITLPAALRTFYECTDGLRIPELGGLVLLSVHELREHARGLDEWRIPRAEFGYLPVAWCTHTTDRLCVAASDALAGRVVWVPHDDGPRVAFPDVPHMLAAIAEAHQRFFASASTWRGGRRFLARLHRLFSPETDDDGPDAWDLHALPRWYGTREVRTRADVTCATTLLERYEPRLAQPRDVIAQHGVGFAIDLMDETQVSALVRLLEHPDMCGRVLFRLARLGTPEGSAAVDAYRSELIALGERLIRVARGGGLDARVRAPFEDGLGGSIQVGARGLRLAYWYSLRNEPDLDQRFLAACATR